MISKEIWLKNITDSIKEIASAEFQEKGWVKGEIHDYCSYVETMCGLFDDSLFDEFIDKWAKQFGLMDEQIQKLDQLRQAIRKFDKRFGGYEDPAIIIKDSEWLKIRQIAKEVLKSLGMEKDLDPSKDVFKDALIFTVRDFANAKSQRRIWIEERKRDTNPFEELVDKFLHSSACKTQEIMEHYKAYAMTEGQKEILVRFYKSLKEYVTNLKDAKNLQTILDDPKWHEIQSLAMEVLKQFKFNMEYF